MHAQRTQNEYNTNALNALTQHLHVYLTMYMYICNVYMYVELHFTCESVCVRERDRDRDRESERDRDRDRDRESKREGESDTDFYPIGSKKSSSCMYMYPHFHLSHALICATYICIYAQLPRIFEVSRTCIYHDFHLSCTPGSLF